MKQKLSNEMLNLTEKHLSLSHKKLINQAKKQIKTAALNGKVRTLFEVKPTRKEYALSRTRVLESFLKKEGFKFKTEEYGRWLNTKKYKNAYWYYTLTISW